MNFAEHEQRERLHTQQRRMLERMLSGAPLDDLLQLLTDAAVDAEAGVRACLVEAQHDGLAIVRCHAAHFPSAFADVLRGTLLSEALMLSREGTDGDRQPVDCSALDTVGSADDAWLALCRRLGIKAYLALPVIVPGGKVVAALVLCLSKPRLMSTWELELAEFGARMAGMAIERERTGAALRSEQERMRAIVDQSVAGIGVFDLTGLIVRANAKLAEILGQSREQLIGKSIADLTDPRDVETSVMNLRQLAGGLIESFSLQKRYVRPDGTRVWVRKDANLIKDDKGQPELVAAVVIDISHQKQAEAALQESESRFRELADTAPAILWVTDADNQLRFISRRWFEHTGQARQETFGSAHGWLAVVHPDDRKAAVAQFTQAARNREPFQLEYRLRRSDGSWRWALDAGQPRFENEGTWIGYIGCVVDVDDQTRAREELRQADRRKDEFLATLAHELRNPLAPIRNGLQLMRLKGSPDSSIHAMMDRQVAHLVTLVDDLMEASRISRGQLDLNLESVDIHEALESALEACLPLAARNHQQIDVHPGAHALRVKGDLVRVTQILSNLLNNAVKFTPPRGKIDVVSYREDPWVVIEVRDTGMGIAMRDVPRIFDMFTQVNRESTRGHGGLGIGLSLALRLAQLHGGTLTAASDGLGLGSTFTLRLPADDAGAPDLPVAPPADRLEGTNVLIVDDNEDAGNSMAMLLRFMGAETRVCHDGPSAILTALSWRPAVALLDLGMPGMSGYELARRFRADPRLSGIPLIALTGWGQAEDRIRTREEGFAGHLVKPVDMADVQAALAALELPVASQARQPPASEI